MLTGVWVISYIRDELNTSLFPATSMSYDDVVHEVSAMLRVWDDVVHVYRDEERVHQFVWHERQKRYSLEIDLTDSTIYITHLFSTRFYAFEDIDRIRDILHWLFLRGSLYTL